MVMLFSSILNLLGNKEEFYAIYGASYAANVEVRRARAATVGHHLDAVFRHNTDDSVTHLRLQVAHIALE